MNASRNSSGKHVAGFRSKILIRIMVIIAAFTLVGVYITNRYLSNVAEQELLSSIEQQRVTVEYNRNLRQQVLGEICEMLSRKARILAALEDDALDLLYPSAQDELRQIIQSGFAAPGTTSLKASFYRFLDLHGNIIEPEGPYIHGELSPELQGSITLSHISDQIEFGYFHVSTTLSHSSVLEIIALPIVSTENYEPIATLIVGFPFEQSLDNQSDSVLDTALFLQSQTLVSNMKNRPLAEKIEEALRGLEQNTDQHSSLTLLNHGIPFDIITKTLNPGSAFPEAKEVFIASKASLLIKQKTLRNRILVVAILLMLAALAASNQIANHLAKPVEDLAVASEQEYQQRIKVEEELDETHQELERAARFSADASHQLKTPVAVMRAGLENLMADNDLSAPIKDEIHDLIRQTGHLSNVIEDLLLLSRLDAGRLKLNLKPENLNTIIDGLLDDFSILPNADQYVIKADLQNNLFFMGERGFTVIIIQNLLENARKYNRPNGSIRIVGTKADDCVVLKIGNNGKTIPSETQSMIFERFHRGAAGEKVQGYGLGLNLAHELATLHKGSLNLISSANDWTEFEVILCSATPPADAPLPPQ